METLKTLKPLIALLLVFILCLGFVTFPDNAKAGNNSEVQCYCTFWGNCKIGGGGGVCFAYEPTIGGDCTSSNKNCGLFNPK